MIYLVYDVFPNHLDLITSNLEIAIQRLITLTYGIDYVNRQWDMNDILKQEILDRRFSDLLNVYKQEPRIEAYELATQVIPCEVQEIYTLDGDQLMMVEGTPTESNPFREIDYHSAMYDSWLQKLG